MAIFQNLKPNLCQNDFIFDILLGIFPVCHGQTGIYLDIFNKHINTIHIGNDQKSVGGKTSNCNIN